MLVFRRTGWLSLPPRKRQSKLKPKSKEFCKWHRIPIWGVWLELVVSEDIMASRNSPKRVSYHGRYNYDGLVYALQSFHGNISTVIFNNKNINHGVIAHECLHSTIRILESRDVDLNQGSQEAYTYLHQHIIELVY